MTRTRERRLSCLPLCLPTFSIESPKWWFPAVRFPKDVPMSSCTQSAPLGTQTEEGQMFPWLTAGICIIVFPMKGTWGRSQRSFGNAAPRGRCSYFCVPSSSWSPPHVNLEIVIKGGEVGGPYSVSFLSQSLNSWAYFFQNSKHYIEIVPTWSSPQIGPGS